MIGKYWSSTMAMGLTAATLSMGLPAESTTASTYENFVASQNPLLAWKFNQNVNFGGTVADYANNLPVGFTNGTDLGSNVVVAVPGPSLPGFQPGNQAFNFNTSGSGSVITTLIQPEAGTPHGMDAGSISMWFRTDDPNPDGELSGVLWRGDEGGGNVLNLRVIDNLSGVGAVSLRLQAGEVDTIIANTDLTSDYSDGAWHHVAASWSYDIVGDAGSMTLHVDGEALGGGETVSALFDSVSYPPILQESDPVNFPGVFDDVMDFDFRSRIGKGRNNARRYNGDIDSAAIWDRELSAQEVADQYNKALVPEPASLALLAGAMGLMGLRRRN